MSEKFTKKCPKCGNEQRYSTPQNYYKALKRNRQCRKCMFSSPEYRKKHEHNSTNMWKDENIRLSILEKRNTDKAKLKWRKSVIPTFNSIEYKLKQSKIQKEILTDEKIKENSDRLKKLWEDKTSAFHSESFREHLREARIKQMNELGVKISNYNPDACKYFDELNKQNGWNLKHALNGGEVKKCGYFLDSYDEDKNIVVEYDEPHHYKFGGLLKNKDVVRQNRIMSLLNCRFFRYNELKQNLYEVIVGKEK